MKYEQWYQLLNQSTEILMKDLNISYLEALLETLENLNDGGKVFVENGKPSEIVAQQLNDLYAKMASEQKDANVLRKAIQLCLLKGMKDLSVHANHQMTPDSIGTLVAFLVDLIVLPQLDGSTIFLADLSVGTGNLLFTVYNYLVSKNDIQLHLTGIDNDDLLLAIASASAALQGIDAQWFFQDSLTPILMTPAQVMVSDLPAGFYPNKENSKKYELSLEQGMSYSHFLLVEQHLNYLMQGGFGLFILPANVFEQENGEMLLQFIQDKADLLAVIRLPEEFFASKEMVKAILLVRKHTDQVVHHAPKVFIGQAPNFKDIDQTKHFLSEIAQWNKQFS